MPAYDNFAWFYNRYWSQEFHSAASPILERIWLPRLAERARVLDVCCGDDAASKMKDRPRGTEIHDPPG